MAYYFIPNGLKIQARTACITTGFHTFSKTPAVRRRRPPIHHTPEYAAAPGMKF